MNNFYDELAESYHLIFDNWDAAIVRQRDVLARLLPTPANGKRILDCTLRDWNAGDWSAARPGFFFAGRRLERTRTALG